MADPLRYYARFQSARGGWTALPGWARGIVLILALPGAVLVALSILMLGVSILALLLLTVPAYRALQALTGTRPVAPRAGPVTDTFAAMFNGPRPGRRQVDAKVVDGAPPTPSD